MPKAHATLMLQFTIGVLAAPSIYLLSAVTTRELSFRLRPSLLSMTTLFNRQSRYCPFLSALLKGYHTEARGIRVAFVFHAL